MNEDVKRSGFGKGTHWQIIFYAGSTGYFITLVEEVSSGTDETVGKQTAAGMQKNGIHRMKVADTVSRLAMY